MFCMRQQFGPAEATLGSFTKKRSVNVRLLVLVSAVVLYLGPGGAHSQQLPDSLQPPESPGLLHKTFSQARTCSSHHSVLPSEPIKY